MTTLCEDDAIITGAVSLFVGIEPAKSKQNWSIQQFIDLGTWCKQHGISTLFIKEFQVGSEDGDEWYSWLPGGFDAIYNALKAIEVLAIPYGYSYALDVNKDIAISTNLLKKYGIVCLDIEGNTWQGTANVNYAKTWAAALLQAPGKLWLSLPANPISSNQQAVFTSFAPAVNVFMPMAYTDYLTSVALNEMHQLNPKGCIQPTIDLSGEFATSNSPNNPLNNATYFKNNGCLAISLWYQQFAKDAPSLTDTIVSTFSGNPLPVGGDTPLQLSTYSKYGVREVRLWWQLIENEPDLCGIATIVALDNSVAPNQPLTVTPETLDVNVDQVCKDVFNIDPVNFPGVLPIDMVNIMNYIRDKSKRLHYQVVAPTMDNIYKALQAGYPLAASWNEKDSSAWYPKLNKWVHAVPWILNAGHVAPIIGYEPSTKNLIVADQLNNSYQEYWPPIYKAYAETGIPGISTSLSWLAVIQLPGLATIPGTDPQKWSNNFNAQTGGNVTVTTSSDQTPTVTQLTFSQSAVLLGETTISHNGTTVNHGLNRKPVMVVPLLDSGYSRDDVISVNYGKMDDKTFTAYSSSASSGNVRFLVL